MVTHNLKIKQDYIIQIMSSLSRNVLRSNIFLYLIIVLNKKILHSKLELPVQGL